MNKIIENELDKAPFLTKWREKHGLFELFLEGGTTDQTRLLMYTKETGSIHAETYGS